MSKARRIMIISEFCSLLDFSCVALKGGVDFLTALQYILPYVKDPYLLDELNKFFASLNTENREIAFSKVFRDVEELNVFFHMLNISMSKGCSLSELVFSEAEELQDRVFYLLEKQCRLTPFKLLIPMVFLLFPACLLILTQPIYSNILRAL